MRSTITPSVINIRATAGINYVKAGAGVTNTHATANIHLNYDSKNFATTDEFTLSDLPAIEITRGTEQEVLTVTDIAFINSSLSYLESLTASDDTPVLDLQLNRDESEDAFVPTDSISLSPDPNFADSATALDDAPVFDIGPGYNESLTLSDLENFQNTFERDFDDAVTVNEDISIHVGRNNLFIAEITLTDDVTTILFIETSLNGIGAILNEYTLN